MKVPRKQDCRCDLFKLRDFTVASPTEDGKGFVVYCPECIEPRVLSIEEYEQFKREKLANS